MREQVVRDAKAPVSSIPGYRKDFRFKLGEFLIQAGVVDQQGIETALAVQATRGGRLGAVLVGLRLCTEEQIRTALRDQLGVEVIDMAEVVADPGLFDLLSVDLMRKYEVIPIKFQEGKLWLATLDPYNLLALDDIRFKTGLSQLVVATCTEGDFKRFLEEHLEAQGVIEEILDGTDFYARAIEHLKDEELPEDIDEKTNALLAHDLRLASNESPTITLCNFLLVEAIRKKASDIHVEPYQSRLRVRLRIDGRLRTILTPPKKLQAAIVARFKIMCDMDITKRRIPQDGHLAISHHGETIHFRVSTLPTIYGEKCVIRLLEKGHILSDIDQLGLREEELTTLKRSLAAPQGLILVTGPTGSGKTTTVHAGLNYINNPEINIVTLEEPVEATLLGINHVPINKQGGVNFVTGLRAILRQDPDIIFVGEIRDTEVATIALRAAQTGHLVISTLHTNSAVESIERLIDIEVPSYIIASTLQLVVAQRLVRRVCEVCAEPYVPSDLELASVGLCREQVTEGQFFKGRGCPACMGTGFRGRLAVTEMIPINKKIRNLIRLQSGPAEILTSVREQGHKTLFADGLEKVLQGKTTLTELGRVLNVEE